MHQFETKKEVEEAFNLGYDLLAFGLLALSEPHIVSKLINHQKMNKTFHEGLLLPSNMYDRLSQWNLESRGYTFQKKQ